MSDPSQPPATPTPSASPAAPEATKSDVSTYIWMAYLVVALGFTIYGTFWGEMHSRGFFYNLGRGLVWPFTAFPVLGKIVGGILAVVFVIWIMSSKNDNSSKSP